MIPKSVRDYMDDRKASGLWHPCYPAKILDLWQWLNEYKPLRIVELGSGITTMLFSEYMQKNNAKLWNLDDSEWQQQTAKHIKADCHGIEWMICNVESNGPDRWYKPLTGTLPERIDLLYVDGPNLNGGLVGIDSCNIANSCDVKNILFDIRESSVKTFERHHPEYTKHKPDHHTWMIKKSNQKTSKSS